MKLFRIDLRLRENRISIFVKYSRISLSVVQSVSKWLLRGYLNQTSETLYSIRSSTSYVLHLTSYAMYPDTAFSTYSIFYTLFSFSHTRICPWLLSLEKRSNFTDWLILLHWLLVISFRASLKQKAIIKIFDDSPNERNRSPRTNRRRIATKPLSIDRSVQAYDLGNAVWVQQHSARIHGPDRDCTRWLDCRGVRRIRSKLATDGDAGHRAFFEHRVHRPGRARRRTGRVQFADNPRPYHGGGRRVFFYLSPCWI